MSLKPLTLSRALAAAFAAALAVLSTMQGPWSAPVLLADSLTCNLSQYKAAQGLTAAVEQDSLLVSWNGQSGADLRARYAIDGGQPIVRELAVRKAGGQWASLGRNLTPEYHVVSGVRRMADRPGEPAARRRHRADPGGVNKHRWYAFWDAPLVMPEAAEMKDEAAWRRSQQPADGRGAWPRRGRRRRRRERAGPEPDARRAAHAVGDQARQTRRSTRRRAASRPTAPALEVTFPGLSMGIFAGDLRFTAYRGTNLLRMDAVAKTNEQWVAYKYDAGLKGFSTDLMPRVTWRDTGGHAQQYQLRRRRQRHARAA